ncbi:Uncharacterised protein [uncultured Eubacterium sp.]|uniref:lysine 5,6-aminomutase reactivase subunit KamB n=1 Tax=Emergencia sp. TaxID=1926557 RepID=UPI000821673A|nr:Uncharacterised protein [uncultured Eubacterium sp.]
MGLLYDLSTKYKTLSIVGMAKNAGKTTALNYLIEEADDEGIRLGITSTGRDGETQDLVTGTEKPKVYLYEDTVVSVPTQLYDLADAGLEIVKKSDYRTSIGDLLLCRVADSGYVQIAGPVATAHTKKMCQEMFEMGCELILIDGAIDRKSIASPETSDAIILSTGAVLSRNLKKVIEDTAHIVELYSLPELEDCKARQLITEHMDEERIMVIKGDWVEILDLTTGLGSSRFIDEAIDDDTDYVYIPGAFTNSVIADINPSKLKRVNFVLKDPTKIFINQMDWGQLRKKKFKVSVMKNIKVAAVTVNPIAPSGYSFDHQVLRDAMQKALADIPVIDVRI